MMEILGFSIFSAELPEAVDTYGILSNVLNMLLMEAYLKS
jgi:hypothetical protein